MTISKADEAVVGPDTPAVLVVWASRHGATAEIAEAIGAVLRERGLRVRVRPVQEGNAWEDYDAVIAGSAVYFGQWRREAVSFLRGLDGKLGKRLLWLFSSGPTGTGDPVDLLKGWVLPKNLRALAERLKPREVKLFHGALEETRLNRAEKLIVGAVKAPLGDFRDWTAVRAWAEKIAEEIGTIARPSRLE